MNKISRQKLFLFLFLGALGALLFFPKEGAAFSARAIGMGTAFTALADDASAVWFNPAGLPLIKKTELIYTRLIGGTDSYGPDDFLAVSIPFGEKQDGALGFAVYNDQRLGTISYLSQTLGGLIRNRQALVSYAQSLFDEFWVGATLKFSQRLEALPLGSQILSSEAQISAYDFGFLWKMSPDLFFGLMVQNANAPEFTIFGQKEPVYANIRPGLCWQIQPNAKVTLDLDDAFGETDGTTQNISMNLNAGAEFKFYNESCLRLGLIHINSGTPSERMVTLGLGVRDNNFYLDAAIVYPISGDLQNKNLFSFVGIKYIF